MEQFNFSILRLAMPSWGGTALCWSLNGITVTILCWRMATSWWYAGDWCASTEGCGTDLSQDWNPTPQRLSASKPHQRVTWQKKQNCWKRCALIRAFVIAFSMSLTASTKLGTTARTTGWFDEFSFKIQPGFIKRVGYWDFMVVRLNRQLGAIALVWILSLPSVKGMDGRRDATVYQWIIATVPIWQTVSQ